jgi:hypothetical protein
VIETGLPVIRCSSIAGPRSKSAANIPPNDALDELGG